MKRSLMRVTTVSVAGMLLAAAGAALASGAATLPCMPSEAALVSPPPAAPATHPRLRLEGRKLTGRQLSRSEAGVTWLLSPKLTLELDYERSALSPMMPHDHDDGVLTRLKLGF